MTAATPTVATPPSPSSTASASTDDERRTRPEPPGRRFLTVLLLIALLGFGIRTIALTTAAKCRQPNTTDLALALSGRTPAGSKCVVLTDAPVYREQAIENAKGHWFQTKELNATGYRQPSGLHPPVFATFLTVFTLGGVRDFDKLRALASLAGIATIIVTGLFARRLLGERAGLIAAFLVAVHPMVWINDIVLMSEGVFALFVPLVGWAALRYWERREVRSAALLGAVIGLAALTRSEAILLVGIMGLPLCVGRARMRSLPAWRHLGAVTLAALIVISPWIGANLMRFQKPALFTTTAGFSMAFANCDAVYRSGPLLGTRDPECLGVNSAGIVLHPTDDQSTIDAQLISGAWRSARKDPSGATKAALARVGRMWGLYQPFQSIQRDEPLERRGIGRSQLAVVFGWEVMAFGAYGAVLLSRRRIPVSPLVGWVVTSTLVAVVDLGLHRFRATSDVALCILATVAIDHLWESYGPRRARPVGETGALTKTTKGTTMPKPSLRGRPDLSARVLSVIAALLVGAGLVIGCGGGSSEGSDATTTTSATTAPSDRTTGTAAPTDIKAFCAAVQNVYDKGKVLADTTFTDASQLPILRGDMVAIVDAMRIAVEIAPGPIRPEATTLKSYLLVVRAALEKAQTLEEFKTEYPHITGIFNTSLSAESGEGAVVMKYATTNCPDLVVPK